MTSTTTVCIFDGCALPSRPNSVKCMFHRNRGVCKTPHCHNQVYARQLCVSHGGRNPCQEPGCDANARLGQYCCRHSIAAKKRLGVAPSPRPCRFEGCLTAARTGGYCWRHRHRPSLAGIEPIPVHAMEHELSMDDDMLDLLRLLLGDGATHGWNEATMRTPHHAGGTEMI
ncbi:hypothetical protein SDRG_02867 [Saprolegnia diclina VS20]|uniref:WRKY19-like zinc finger domain-containing protein n=1 Tax=Saprolegnia diclina (strain VS20) TaxID=1156394 RepID=T0QQ12_SAPDV|nr:hypothetical protein SDRG_02867 [Saprolegnia diclina VS20]EQC40219.1 hypothetical protein SDRG_02867 [Saprolegnia diclina VS20]|eukprot:XP_008606693.1 hypothetical protein SDRG_02867 [Saprolegnia diclina VS20]